MSIIRTAGIVKESIVDGPGIRYVIFTQGCPHHCEGCHNPDTHDFQGGTDIDSKKMLEEFCKDPLLAGVTLSGGEPFCQAEQLLDVAKAVKAMKKSVMIYSGYTIEELWKMSETNPAVEELLSYCDLLVDGKFILAERDLSLRFRGSRNQRVLDVPESIRQKKPVLWADL